MAILEHRISDLVHHLLDLGDCSVEEFDKQLEESYGISFDNFQKLIKDLVPLCDKYQTKHKVFRGFSSNADWIVRDEFEN